MHKITQIFSAYSTLTKGLILVMTLYLLRSVSFVIWLPISVVNGSFQWSDLLMLFYVVIPVVYLSAAFLLTKTAKQALRIINVLFGALLVFGLLFSLGYEGGASGPAGLMVWIFAAFVIIYFICQVSVREVLRAEPA